MTPKQHVVRKYGKIYGLRILIETGTFGGDMMAAMLDHFDILYSIEIDFRMHREAVRRFADHSKVKLLHGDSGEILPELLRQIDEPALFWLDGHYSGDGTARGSMDTPVRMELEAIRNWPFNQASVILLDDAGMFTGRDGYPTLSELSELMPGREIIIAGEIIRIYAYSGY